MFTNPSRPVRRCWEPERLAHLLELMEASQGMDHGQMYTNYQYFLDAAIPACERYRVRLAVPCNELCLGSFSSRRGNDTVVSSRPSDRIYFSHVRNIPFTDGQGSFYWVDHRAFEGKVDTVGIIEAYAEADYQDYIRPDHGRHLWSENTEAARPRLGHGIL